VRPDKKANRPVSSRIYRLRHHRAAVSPANQARLFIHADSHSPAEPKSDEDRTGGPTQPTRRPSRGRRTQPTRATVRHRYHPQTILGRGPSGSYGDDGLENDGVVARQTTRQLLQARPEDGEPSGLG